MYTTPDLFDCQFFCLLQAIKTVATTVQSFLPSFFPLSHSVT